MSINAITDLAIETPTKTGDDTNLDFKFTRPTCTGTSSTGGYYLYVSSTGSDYIYYDYKVDSIHMRDLSISTSGEDEDGYIHFTTTITEDYLKGKLLYFKMLPVDTLGNITP